MKFNFTDVHYEFLEKELNTSQEMVNAMSETELDNFYEKVLDIELAETPSNSEPMTLRGETAVEIVNIMAEALGYIPENNQEEWEAEMAD